MVTLTIELRKSTTNKEGKHPIYLRLGKDRNKKFISLGLSAKKEQWNEEFGLFKADKRLNSNYKEDNLFIQNQLKKADDVVKSFEKKFVDFTFNQFEEAFYGYAKKVKVKEYILQQIKDLDETGHIGNANCYNNVLALLERFDKKLGERVFSEIDYS